MMHVPILNITLTIDGFIFFLLIEFVLLNKMIIIEWP